MVLAVLAGGSAEAGELDLEWRAPKGCPELEQVAARVVAAADGAELAAVHVVVDVERAGKRWRATLAIGEERRVLAGATCNEVSSAAALVIGLALRQAHEDIVEPPAEEVPPRLRPAAEPSVDVLRMERAEPARSTVQFAGAAEAGAEIGTLPQVAVVVSGAAGVARDHLALWLGASYATSAAPAEADGLFTSARVSRVAATGRLCATVHALSVCAGGEVGRLAATVASPDDRDAGAGLWVSAAAGAGLAVPLGRMVEVGLATDLVLPLAYPRFSVNGMDALPGPGIVGSRAGTSLRIHFR